MLTKSKFLALGIVVTVIFAGCTGNSGETSSGTTGGKGNGKKLQIAMIPKGTTHVFWKAVERGAQKAAGELNVELFWKGPLKEDNREEQIKVVEDFTTKHVDGICLAPLDQNALKAPVETAIEKDIPIVIFDSALADSKAASFVATDNKEAGRIAARSMAKLLDNKGKVVVMRYQEGSASTAEREDGFIEEAKKAGLEVVSDNQYAGATVESATSKAESFMPPFKDSIQGVFTPNESSTVGMLLALKNLGIAGKVKFIGFDSSDPLIEGIQSGTLSGVVIQNPEKMGYLTIKTMVAKINGEKVDARIDTGSEFVDAEKLKDPEVMSRVKPK